MKTTVLKILLLVSVLISTGFLSKNNNDSLHPEYLRCENLVNPLGIDALSPRLSWYSESRGKDQLQTAYQILVASSLKKLDNSEGDLWDSKKVNSDQSINILYKGKPLTSGIQCFWKVKIWDKSGKESSWSEPAKWSMGLLNTHDWSGAQWITGADSPVAPLLRIAFRVISPVAKARLYISAAGYYVASINGHRVGNAVLDPGFTAYNKRVLYSTYDVTGMICSGTNVLGAVLGRGFYAIRATAEKILWWDAAPWLARDPLLLAKLEITYKDGTHATVVSGPDWTTHPGPTTSNDLYRGETYDARLLPAGWDTPGYEAKDWTKVWVAVEPKIVVKKALYGVLNDSAKTSDVTAAVQARMGVGVQSLPINSAGIKQSGMAPPTTHLVAEMNEPIRVVNRLKAVSITQPKPGVYVYEFPVMIAGWPRLTVSGPAGTTVILRCGEKLNADGSVNNQGDPGLTPGEIQRYEYTLSGKGTEVWEPQFSYAGFQYVQVNQFPGTPDTNSVVACEVRSDVPTIGSFSCSSLLLNQVHDICQRSVLNNLHSIFTDSPMFEKRGWGDDGSLCAQAADNFGMENFYEKWLNDIGDTQNELGNIADIAPSTGHDYYDPSWSSDFVVLPWRLYQEYGDVRPMSAHYAAMKRYIEYLGSQATNHLLKGFYGDWVSPGYVQPPEGPNLVASANYYRDVLWFSKMAAVLGHSADAARFVNLAGKIKQAFNAKYLDRATGVYHTELKTGYRQTSNALPLDYGMVPADMVAPVVSNLVADVRKHGNHLNTGSFGTAALLSALSDHDEAQVAYAIASQSNYPSWGWWLVNGATTTWEQWITGPALRSRDHAFLGTVDDWFYKYLGGIRPAEPGYKVIEIRPCFLDGLSWVQAAIQTPYGMVSSRWKRDDSGEVKLTIEVPPNARANVWIPGSSSSRQFGSGQHTVRFTLPTPKSGG